MKEINITIPENYPIEKILDQLEKTIINTVLVHNRYNQSKTAKDIGISRGTLLKKIKKYEL